MNSHKEWTVIAPSYNRHYVHCCHGQLLFLIESDFQMSTEGSVSILNEVTTSFRECSDSGGQHLPPKNWPKGCWLLFIIQRKWQLLIFQRLWPDLAIWDIHSVGKRNALKKHTAGLGSILYVYSFGILCVLCIDNPPDDAVQ